jgi:hypothetical protein
VPDECDVIRSHGPSLERHCRFIRRAVSLLVVAVDTCTHQVLPRVLSSPRNRLHVIHGQCQVRSAAILALVGVAAQDVFPREDDLLVRNPYIHSQSQDARERHRHGHRADSQCVVCFNQLCFSQVHQHDGLPDIDYAHRLVVLIQDQNFCIHLSQ